MPNFKFITQSSSSGLVDFDPEPEKTVRKNLRKIREILEKSSTRVKKERAKSSTMNDPNENMDLPRANEFENPPDGIPRVLPLNVDPPLRGNGNNVNIIPKHEVNLPVAPRTMMDYCRPNLDGASTSISRLRVAANNSEIKPNVIQMVQQYV